MYPTKVSYSILHPKHNLQNVILETKNSTKHLMRYSLTFRQLSLSETCRNVHDFKTKFLKLVRDVDLINIFRKNLTAMPENLKSQSTNLLRVWTHQCECVVAQRLRRGQQMFCLYSRLWGDRALKEFFNRIRQQVTNRGKEIVFSAIGVAAYNWDSNRIRDNEIKEHESDIEYMHYLKDNTMICELCKNYNKCSGKVHCNCPNRKNIYSAYDEWSVFIEKEDMIVWRRLHKSGSYEYKVYGSFNDVCADDFLNVQIDIDYRKTWDSTAISLNVVERDPNPTTNSDVVYWEMLWPRLFANRDYVFQRRYMVNFDTKTVLLVSKGTEHPKCPSAPHKHRVEEYWSHMVIKPYTDFKSPGLEFGLTYFDNPGINIPAAVTAWVAYRAMPDFLNRLRSAAREYPNYCLKCGCDRQFTFEDPEEQPAGHDEKRRASISLGSLMEHDETRPLANFITGTMKTKMHENSIEKYPGSEIMASPSPIVQPEGPKHSYWKYLQPTYYFS